MKHLDMSTMHLFRDWLLHGGAEVLAPTRNGYEVLRFSAEGQVHVIYRNAKHDVSYSSDATQDIVRRWRANEPAGFIRRAAQVKGPERIRALAKRDGMVCFFCGCALDIHTATVEELFSRGHGGLAHMSNQTLACEPCNNEAGTLPVIVKVKMRESKQAKTEGLHKPTESK